jgi:hypothetical protein
MLRSLSQIADCNKFHVNSYYNSGYLDIPQNELRTMIKKLSTNPYWKLAETYSYATEHDFSNLTWLENYIKAAKELYDNIEIKPKWVDVDKLNQQQAKIDAKRNEREAEQKAQDEERKKLEEWAKTVEITDDIRKKWFKSYGMANSWTHKDSAEWSAAKLLHDRDMKENPGLHEGLIEIKDPSQRGINNKIICKSCGLSHSWDSSD